MGGSDHRTAYAEQSRSPSLARACAVHIVPSMGTPLAFLLTFRTYGTWLHGDERGSVDRTHNAVGTPLLPPHAPRVEFERGCLRAPPLLFDETMRGVVAAAFVDECRYRAWELLAYAVRSNHAHVVVGYAGVGPGLMAGRMKARATCWLRERGCIGADQPVWVDRGGSERWLWKPDDVVAARAYVEDGQDMPR